MGVTVENGLEFLSGYVVQGRGGPEDCSWVSVFNLAVLSFGWLVGQPASLRTGGRGSAGAEGGALENLKVVRSRMLGTRTTIHSRHDDALRAKVVLMVC